MPSLTSTQVLTGYYAQPCSLFAVVRYGGALHIVLYTNRDGVTIIDVTNRKAQNIGGAYTNAVHPFVHRVMELLVGKSSIKARIVVPTQSGLDIVDVDIDLSEKSATTKKINTVTPPNWNANCGRWSMVAEASRVINGRYLIGCDGRGYINVFDLIKGEEVFSFNSGFTGEYWARPSWKMTVKDDLYIILGRHFAGDPMRICKLFSKQIIEISPSFSLNTGGSPRPHIGIPLITRKTRIFPVTWGGVVGVKNDILVLDDAFNVAFGIDISKLTPGWDVYDIGSGFAMLGVMKDGGVLAYSSVLNFASLSNPNVSRLVLFKFEPPSSPSKVEPTVLAYTEYQNIHHGDIGTIGCDFTDGIPRPVVDLKNAKIYTIVDRVDFTDKKHHLYLVEIDISDIIDDVEEWNELLYFASA